MIGRAAILAGLLVISAIVIALVKLAPDRLSQVKTGMTLDQVTAIMGQPASIEQSESVDQTISGEVDHYPTHHGEARIIYVNHAVFKIGFVPGAKS